MKEPLIHCPKCEWRPKPESKWQCNPGCQTVWNTFWTAGVCPGCGKAWHKTKCPKCFQFSPHKDWYLFPDDEGQAVEDEVTEKTGA